MKARIHYLLHQVLKRCPKSGRVVGVRRDTPLARGLFPLVSLLAIAWFLLRTLPEPRRADYPCQKVAAGIGVGFIAWLSTVLLTMTGLRILRRRVGVVAAVAAGVAVMAFIYHSESFGVAGKSSAPFPTAPQVFTAPEGVNQPMGEGKGIFPGRVAWVQDFAATKWDGKTGNWWENQNVDQAVVDKMFSRSLQELTGAKTEAEAWNKLFRHFNQTRGRGERSYQKGEKINIKVNLNADEKPGPWQNCGYPTPHLVYAMVRGLIEHVGVPGNCITLNDSSRPIKDMLVSRLHADPRPDFHQVLVADRAGGSEPWRVKSEPDMDRPIHFDMPDNVPIKLYLPKAYTQATYLIDFALFRPHRVFGVTMAFKNHFGSVYDPEGQYKGFRPNQLHAFALWDYTSPYKHGQVNGLVPLLGHQDVGGKTLLYFVDGLYTPPNQTATVVRWSTLGDRWFSSVLASLDPVALDSVGYDLICTEPNLTTQPDGRPNPSFNGNVDGYLHEAALAANPPSKAKYDPEDDGSTLASLGVHEHWNNAKEMKYSRNLGKKDGIELIRISAK
jgi:hypothetical protein